MFSTDRVTTTSALIYYILFMRVCARLYYYYYYHHTEAVYFSVRIKCVPTSHVDDSSRMCVCVCVTRMYYVVCEELETQTTARHQT